MDESEHQARCIEEAPSNQLEAALAAVMAGEISKEEFLSLFLKADVFVLVASEPEGDTLGDCTPLVLQPPDGGDHLLVLFSSPLRVLKIRELFSEYQWTVRVPCTWALRILGASLGITLNPGCDLGFELARAGAHELKQALDGPGART